ncbi:hypothetical protein FACS18945_1260 [Bacteroidia bacterium]|nr:hypothetical protein FACS18945_1260 [Bacteroidia bacterium]
MARPIADTPVLRGQDAVRFMERMENVQKISAQEREEIRRDFEFMQSRANFSLI